MSKRFRSKLRVYLLITGLVFAGCLIAGCGGSGGSTSGNPGTNSPSGTLPPAIAVSTNQIAFGNVVVGQFSDRSVSVSNGGGSPLSIGRIAQAVPAATHFSIQDDTCSEKTLRASETCSVTIRFSPQAQGGPFSGGFNIPSSDPSNGTLAINVSGFGDGLNVTINGIENKNCSSPEHTVRLIVSVTDAGNNPIEGLEASNFKVWETGSPKAIASFFGSITTPISFGLAVDQSHSITRTPGNVTGRAVIDSVNGFIDSMGDGDEAALVKFAREIRLYQEFTTNKALLKAAMNDTYPEELGDATFVYDAAVFTVDQVFPRTNDRRIVIMISDFDDYDSIPPHDGSVSTFEEVTQNAREKGIFIYTIGLGEDLDIEIMQRIADETGGQWFEVDYSGNIGAQLTEIYTRISEITKNQYVLEFLSTRAGSSIIDVQVTHPDGRVGQDTRDSFGCP